MRATTTTRNRRHLIGANNCCLIALTTSLALIINAIGMCNAYKVLMFCQTLTRSHIILNARVAEVLASAGHNVTILEMEYFEPLDEFQGSEAHGVQKIKISNEYVQRLYKMDKVHVQKFLAQASLKRPTLWSIYGGTLDELEFHRFMNDVCEKFIDNHPELLARLKAEEFDVYIGGQINFCGSALSHVLGIPVHLLLTTCPIQEHVASLLGLSNPSSFVPSIYGVPFNDRMSRWERFVNWAEAQFYAQTFLYGIDHLTAMFQRKFGAQFPDVRQIVANSPLVFVNVDELVDFPRPLFPNIVYIGGIDEVDNDEAAVTADGKKNNRSAQMRDSLEQEPWRSVMSMGECGVVFFSLGSALNTTLLPAPFMHNVFHTFAQLPEWHFVVKIDEADAMSRMQLGANITNVYMTAWAPQRAILANPRTKLFISHGGYNSLMESAHAGCPILTLGFFADQRRNALLPERNGWGLSVMNTLLLEEGSDEFRARIERMLREPSFGRAAKRLKKLLATKPFSAREQLTRYIRLLEENGGQLPELMAESRQMSTIAYYNLDLCLIVAATLLLTLFCVWSVLAFCWRAWRRRNGREGKTKEE